MKIAVLGTWHVHTREYAEAIQAHPHGEVAIVWDDCSVRGKAFADSIKVPFTTDLDAVLRDSEIEAVQVTTATSMHKDVLIKAANAGKHIFTEKVLALSNDDAEEIKSAILGSGINFTISFPHQCWPAFIEAKQMVESGDLGTITYVKVRDAHNGSIAEWLPEHFYDVNETGGGAMIDLGAHPVYMVNWLLGDPVSVVSMFTEVTNRGVDDNAVSIYSFKNGAIGVAETGFVSEGNDHILEISGTKGSILFHDNILEYRTLATDGNLQTKTEFSEEKLPLPRFLDSIVNREVAQFGIDEAVQHTKMILGAHVAAKTDKRYYF